MDTKQRIEDTWNCMDCGGYGDAFEVLPNDGGDTKEQVWVYCKPCDVETFHDLPDDYEVER